MSSNNFRATISLAVQRTVLTDASDPGPAVQDTVQKMKDLIAQDGYTHDPSVKVRLFLEAIETGKDISGQSPTVLKQLKVTEDGQILSRRVYKITENNMLSVNTENGQGDYRAIGVFNSKELAEKVGDAFEQGLIEL